MKPDFGSRAVASAGSCGSSMMRLPSGSVPPLGSGRRMRAAFTQLFGTVSASVTLTQTVGLSDAK